jgi:hypothetical protein
MSKMRKMGWVIAAIIVALPLSLDAKTVKRPLTDFLEAQGTSSSFFPPFPDYVGWINGDTLEEAENFCLIDYAGVAGAYMLDEYFIDLGTEVRGQVFEKELPDGSAEIKVVLHTKNALGFMQDVQALVDSGFDFAGTPTVFGNKALDVANGAPPALGAVSLNLTFRIAAPGDDLPDFQAIVFTPIYDPTTYLMRGTIFDEDGQMMKLVQKSTGVRDLDGAMLTSPDFCEIRGHR